MTKSKVKNNTLTDDQKFKKLIAYMTKEKRNKLYKRKGK